jgi:hypothetical protein
MVQPDPKQLEKMNEMLTKTKTKLDEVRALKARTAIQSAYVNLIGAINPPHNRCYIQRDVEMMKEDAARGLGKELKQIRIPVKTRENITGYLRKIPISSGKEL